MPRRWRSLWKERTPRLDWAGLLKRTFALDVFACLRCGGRLKDVGAREGSRRGESDCGAPGVAHGECAPGPCARAAPERGVLKLKPPQPAKSARPLPRPAWEGGWAGQNRAPVLPMLYRRSRVVAIRCLYAAYTLPIRSGLVLFWSQKTGFGSENASAAPVLRGRRLGSGGLLSLEAEGIEPAARSFWRERSHSVERRSRRTSRHGILKAGLAEFRGCPPVACALARCGWGGTGEGARAGAAAPTLSTVDAALSASGAVGTAESSPSSCARCSPCSDGGHGGKACGVGRRGRVVHPVLWLRVAGNAALPFRRQGGHLDLTSGGTHWACQPPLTLPLPAAAPRSQRRENSPARGFFRIISAPDGSLQRRAHVTPPAQLMAPDK
ncbi:hypothetical protein SAMN05443639_106319 [Stigmatella erecta]|uniref:Uncharacterized protein n=1 Tax=Stigmatella erecta TaxID=83460 RepID=A0A1I0IVF5_9BACT|nr:hypothetical protein SAMN05443639_106319 [Stigmatella erecta]